MLRWGFYVIESGHVICSWGTSDSYHCEWAGRWSADVVCVRVEGSQENVLVSIWPVAGLRVYAELVLIWRDSACVRWTWFDLRWLWVCVVVAFDLEWVCAYCEHCLIMGVTWFYVFVFNERVKCFVKLEMQHFENMFEKWWISSSTIWLWYHIFTPRIWRG